MNVRALLVPAAVAVSIVFAPGLARAQAQDGYPWDDGDESTLRAEPGERRIVPQSYRFLDLDRKALHARLAQAPMEFTHRDQADEPVTLALPMPDGSALRFSIEESPIMEPGLAVQFPEIKTYRGQGLDDQTATTRFGWTSAGFHAIVLRASGTVYIDPYRLGDTVHYISYAKRDLRARAEDRFRCLLDEIADDGFSGPEVPPTFAPSGDTLRTYRLALGATVEYSDFHSAQVPPSKTDVMNNGIIPTMNRVNGVYERDVAIRMVLVANELNVIFVVEPDPYTNNSGGAMLGQNQTTMDGPLMGTALYDIGHVFSTGGGGVANLRVPCVDRKSVV